MEIVKIKMNDLKPYSKNAKKHSKKQIERIAKSIESFGFNDPIGIWKDNIVTDLKNGLIIEVNKWQAK